MRIYCLLMIGLALLCGMAHASDLVVDGALVAENVRASGTVSAVTSIVTTGSVSAASVTASAVNAGSATITNDLTAGNSAFSVKTSSGRVGINNTAPDSKLDVKNGIVTISDSSTGRKGVFISQSATLGVGKIATDFWYGTGGGYTPLTFWTGGSERIRIDTTGKVGIGLTTPTTALDVNGAITLRNMPTGTSFGTTSSQPVIYAKDGRLHVVDSSRDDTVTSPHVDPREIYPVANTSFEDLKVAYPFSFYHKNPLLGLEQAVDMSKMVAWVEKKMKEEMGEEPGRLVFTKALKPEECITVEQHNSAQVQERANEIIAKIENMPWVKVETGPDGRIPDEAFEEVPEYTEAIQKVRMTKKEIDFESRRLVDRTSYEDAPVQIPTGKTKTQLRPGWELRHGELFRKPTMKDINVEEMIASTPQLPQWIIDRVHAGQQASMDVKALADEIRKLLAAKTPQSQTQQAAQVVQ